MKIIQNKQSLEAFLEEIESIKKLLKKGDEKPFVRLDQKQRLIIRKELIVAFKNLKTKCAS